MFTRRLLPALVTILAATAILSLARAEDKNAIEVSLKDFKFKVQEGTENLFGLNEGEGKLFFYTNGKGEATVKLPDDGDFEIVIKASCDSALDEKAKFKLTLDGDLVGKETTLTSDNEKDYTFKVNAKKGERKVGIEFTNDVFKENEYDRNLYIHAVTVKKAK